MLDGSVHMHPGEALHKIKFKCSVPCCFIDAGLSSVILNALFADIVTSASLVTCLSPTVCFQTKLLSL